MNKTVYCILFLAFLLPQKSNAQFDEDQMGAWYMYFFNTNFKESKWGLQGDVQFRNWDLGGDLEQLLLRGGITYSPSTAKVKLTLGYGHITTGAFGESSSTTTESRIYQEALFPVKFGSRFYTNHRFRYEQRFVENQDFRTRYRYNLFLNIPLNSADFQAKTVYLSMYNELFINGERQIGDDRTVEIFDRNRTYLALGYMFRKGLKMQLGVMKQTTDNWSKYQMQLSLHHSF
ncbi:MAG: DUF2490 domain-containing protein [Flavobacteriaceae bacterium]|nr:DUF2490 domain-containing protein [Flavobacteriaceae bacterium]